MAQSIAIAEFVTAIAGYVMPGTGIQQALIATSDSNVHNLSLRGQQIAQDLFAQLDEGVLYGIAGYVTSDNVQHAIVATSENNVYHLSSAARARQLLAHLDDVMVTAVAGYAGAGGQHAVIATSEGSVSRLSFQADGQATQQVLGQFESGVISISALVTPADNVEHILVAASDGYIHHFALSAGQEPVRSVLGFFEESFISLTGYVTADGLLHIIPGTRDGKLYHVVYDAHLGQEVHVDIRDGIHFHDAARTPGVSVDILIRFYKLTESGMMFVAGYATPADDRQHVLVATSDGSVYHLSYEGRPQKIEEVSHEVIAQFNSMY